MSIPDAGAPARASVCHVTTAHSRRDTRIRLKECASMAAAGYDVHLVVGDGLGDETTADGIRIHDIGAKPASRFRRIWFQPARAERKVVELAPDFVHFHDPEFLPAAARLRRRGLRVVYDIHEDVPRQIETMLWMPAPMRGPTAAVFEAYEDRIAGRFSGLVAATPHIERRFAGRGVPTLAACNFPLPHELFPEETEVARENRICYVGAMARVRGTRELIDALALVPEVRLSLCGGFGEPGLEAELKRSAGWAQVDYFGNVDRTGVRRVMATSLAGIVTFLDAPNHVNALPNKMFEYMSAGLPVIASDFPSWREIVDSAQCGVCVDPARPDRIAEAIRRIVGSPGDAQRMGRSGRDAVMTTYNWPAEARKLLAFYEALP